MDLRDIQDQNLQKSVSEKMPNPTTVAIEQIKMAVQSNFLEKWEQKKNQLLRLSSKVGNLEPENVVGIDILVKGCMEEIK